jgi:CcmD family protein
VSTGEKYLFGAYAVLFAVVLAYVVIIALKLGRLERELTELAELARSRKEEREMEHVG